MPCGLKNSEYFPYYARRLWHILQHLRAKYEIELIRWKWQAFSASYAIDQRSHQQINRNIGLHTLLQQRAIRLDSAADVEYA